MEIDFAVSEMVALLAIVNNWPIRKAGEWRLLNALGDKVTLTADEEDACHWQEVRVATGRAYLFDGSVAVTRELSDRERESLLEMVQNPPTDAPWRRVDRPVYESLVCKLNGETGTHTPEV